jgi:4-hydroxybenzoate polyprenyltransferase
MYAFVGVGHIIPLVFWLFPVAALLGVSLNLANSLPDVEQDAENGARTLAVVLGVRGTVCTSLLLIFLAIALIGILAMTHIVAANSWIVFPILIVACLVAVIVLLFFRPEKSIQMRKTYFYCVVLTCLGVAGGWIIGVIV